MKKLIYFLSLIILTVSCNITTSETTDEVVEEVKTTNFCYEVVVELTDRTDNGATIDIYDTRQEYTIFVHNKNLGIEVTDVTNNMKLVNGNFSYYKCNLGKGNGILAQWSSIASYIKRYKVINIKKKYY